jgi:flavin-dependent dehydrogenase
VGLCGLEPAPARHRAESLRATARVALEELGLSSSFEREANRPSYLRKSSWAGQVLERHSLEGIHGPDHHLDRARFDDWFLEHARERRVECFVPMRVVAARFDGHVWRLELGGRSGLVNVSARTLIDATGRSASLGRKLGARVIRRDRLVGLARRHAAPPHEPIALVESAENGWWYSAPVPSGELVALFVTEPEARQTRSEQWKIGLASAPLTRARLEPATALDAPRAYAVAPQLTVAEDQAPWLAVGDAAAAFDPLSGDGLCFALRSALEAATCVQASLSGASSALAAYRAGVARVFEHHLARRAEYYRAEQLSRASSFWSRRAGAELG